jgi:hypothetical protein
MPDGGVLSIKVDCAEVQARTELPPDSANNLPRLGKPYMQDQLAAEIGIASSRGPAPWTSSGWCCSPYLPCYSGTGLRSEQQLHMNASLFRPSPQL